MKVLTQSEELAMEEGLEKGLAQGREEGREEGRVEAVLTILRGRFQSVPENLPQRLRDADPGRLRELLTRAFLAEDLQSFLTALDTADSDS